MTSPTSTDTTTPDTMPIPHVLRRLLDRTARTGVSPDDDVVAPVLLAVIAEIAPTAEDETDDVDVRDIADRVQWRRPRS